MSQLRFSDAHVWVRLEDDVAVLGLSDYLQDQMGEITTLELPDLGGLRITLPVAAIPSADLRTLRLNISNPYADRINYEVTVDDPTTFTTPWTASIPMVKSDGPIFEYACHEANYSIVDILRASRAQDNAPKDGPQ